MSFRSVLAGTCSPVPGGRTGRYHDDVDGYDLVSEAEIEEWLEEGLLVKTLPQHPQKQ